MADFSRHFSLSFCCCFCLHFDTAKVKIRFVWQIYVNKMAPVKISNLKAFEIFKRINGPARRKESRGAVEVDLALSREILHECGIQLKPFENVSLKCS